MEKINKDGKEMTRYAFISHMEAYMRKLLTNPKTADADDFLKSFGLDGPKCKSLLIKRTEKDDPNSAILYQKESIKNGKYDKNGVRQKDTFSIKYKIPRKGYNEKMKKLYNSLFESKSNNSPLMEINANRLPERSKIHSQKQGKDKIRISFGKNGMGLSDELSKIGKKIEKLSKNNNVYLSKPSFDTEDDVYDFMIELEPIDKKKEKKEWEIYHSGDKHKKTLSEEGEGGGATSCGGEASCGGGATNADSSGQFTQPLFGKPLRRKLYITREQADYLKNVLKEDSPAECDTAFGDFGYDAPGLKKKKDPAYNHKNMMQRSWDGGIDEESMHIKKKNKGKFTATKKRTGKSTSELMHSKNSLTRKRANFARMAKRHWKPLDK